MPVTQKDVALQAGVTRSVVSHVMHGSGDTIRVNPETAARVRKIAGEMGYQPNALARNFRRQKTGMIGLLHGDGFPMIKFDQGSRYFASLMDGIVEGAFAQGYTLGFCPDLLGSSPDEAMGDGRFDGFIWYSTFPSVRNEMRLKKCTTPTVLIHSKAETFDNRFPTVICNNDQGIRLALEHLADLGHRRIAFAYDGDYLSSESRMRRDAFLAHGSCMGLDVTLLDAGANAAGLRNYFESVPRETAFIGHSEDYAVDAMRLAKAIGLRVPEDYSIVGFDSTSYCELQNPPLTAISQPLVQMGSLAVTLLVEWIAGRKPELLEHVLPCGLDARGSTGPAPA